MSGGQKLRLITHHTNSSSSSSASNHQPPRYTKWNTVPDTIVDCAFSYLEAELGYPTTVSAVYTIRSAVLYVSRQWQRVAKIWVSRKATAVAWTPLNNKTLPESADVFRAFCKQRDIYNLNINESSRSTSVARPIYRIESLRIRSICKNGGSTGHGCNVLGFTNKSCTDSRFALAICTEMYMAVASLRVVHFESKCIENSHEMMDILYHYIFRDWLRTLERFYMPSRCDILKLTNDHIWPDWQGQTFIATDSKAIHVRFNDRSMKRCSRCHGKYTYGKEPCVPDCTYRSIRTDDSTNTMMVCGTCTDQIAEFAICKWTPLGTPSPCGMRNVKPKTPDDQHYYYIHHRTCGETTYGRVRKRRLVQTTAVTREVQYIRSYPCWKCCRMFVESDGLTVRPVFDQVVC